MHGAVANGCGSIAKVGRGHGPPNPHCSSAYTDTHIVQYSLYTPSHFISWPSVCLRILLRGI